VHRRNAIRHLTAELLDDFDRTGVPMRRIAPGPDAQDAQLGMTTAVPMNVTIASFIAALHGRPSPPHSMRSASLLAAGAKRFGPNHAQSRDPRRRDQQPTTQADRLATLFDGEC